MKLKFMIYLVTTTVVVTALSNWSQHLQNTGDIKGANVFFWLTVISLCLGALLTLRRAFRDELIKN